MPALSRKTSFGLIAFGIACTITGIFFLMLGAAPVLAPPAAPTPPSYSMNPVEEPVPPDARASYDVASDLPRLISIPKLAASARIVSVGKERSGNIQAPASIYDVGWFRQSAKPGQRGVMFIDGHVSGPTQPGVFKHLTSLFAGDIIDVERGDHTHIQYKVERVESLPVNQIHMSQLLHDSSGDSSSLILMTCGGRFNKTTQQYDNRVIVHASIAEN